jgi:hypothetical protein
LDNDPYGDEQNVSRLKDLAERFLPSTSHGIKNTKLRSSVRTSISAPAKPPTTLVARSNHSHRRRTPASSRRVRHTAVG